MKSFWSTIILASLIFITTSCSQGTKVNVKLGNNCKDGDVIKNLKCIPDESSKNNALNSFSCDVETKTLKVTWQYNDSLLALFTGYEIYASTGLNLEKSYQGLVTGIETQDNVTVPPTYEATLSVDVKPCASNYYYIAAVGSDSSKTPYSAAYCVGTGCP